MINIFTAHPHSEGFTYLEHLKRAFLISGKMALAALAGIIHGIFPFLFVKTMSNTVTKVHQKYSTMPITNGQKEVY